MKSLHLNKVGIVLQGMPESSNQATELCEYYNSLGFSNIVISSYSEQIDVNKLQEKFNVILNDDKLKHADRDFRRVNTPRGKNQNFQIETTKKGIEYLKDNTDVEYVLKHRFNDCIIDLDKFVLKWIDSLNSDSGDAPRYFNKKIIIMGKCGTAAYTCDYWNFGTTIDMWNLWNIPPNTMAHLQAEEYINYCYLFNKDNITHWEHSKESNALYKKYEEFFIEDGDVRNKGYSFKYKNFYVDYSNVGHGVSKREITIKDSSDIKVSDDTPDIIKNFISNGYTL